MNFKGWQGYKNVLVVAAHPDDEVLGCGGTIARMAEMGKKVTVVILGEGKTSRLDRRDPSLVSDEISQLKKEAQKASSILGVDHLVQKSFPDNRFDSVDLLDMIKTLEHIKSEVRPDLVFTHYREDLNIDHQVVSQAVLTAFRPLPEERAKAICFFETLSSTEWNPLEKFSPNVFVDISSTLEDKVRAMEAYQSEICRFPHPRSAEGIRSLASRRGSMIGVSYAEAFQCVRCLI